ncbi:MAG TPA: glycosyltransferase [Acetobacteraceae bacterium]
MDQTTSRELALVIPVFEDWASVVALLMAIDQCPTLEQTKFHVILVNDGGGAFDRRSVEGLGCSRFRHIEIFDLVCNLGHQRAIAVGLVGAESACNVAGVVVMDGDGEDQPEDIPKLLQASLERPGHIICARRSKRSEPMLFRFCYWAYKSAFWSLTGTRIGFGNFCYIPTPLLRAVVHSPSTWNHLAASILRSKIPVSNVDTIRGRRLVGESKMNFMSLILHGMSAISVYADVALVRMVLAMLAISGIALLGMLTVIAERFLTDLAIPGWASNVFGSLAIILLQSLVFATIAAFMLLNARSTKPVIPAIDAMQFVVSAKLASDQISRFRQV